MKTKIIVVTLVSITAGVFTFTRTKNALPSDFRDAVAERSPEFNTDIPVFENDNGNLLVPKAVAVEGSNSMDAALNSGTSQLEGYQAMIVERERAEQALKAIKTKLGENAAPVFKAEDIYNDIKATIYAWGGTAKIRLAGNASISSKSECKYLADAVRKNDILTSYVSVSVGFHATESLFKLHTYDALCGGFLSTGTLEKWLKETQSVYNRADSAGKDKIFEDIEALGWKFTQEIKP